MSDLIWGEKSPAIVAIAINSVIVVAPLVIGALLGIFVNFGQIGMLVLASFFVSLMMIYATITQLILMMKTPKRSLLAIAILVAAVFLPFTILARLGINYYHHTIWLFSIFFPLAISFVDINTMFMTLLSQLSILILLNIQLRRQLRLAGESA
ncbi:MAG: hypothetical protein F6K36_24410 [Symploca sp. SIO3C6]|nr:hypothetical protein [Symploca sp. SIO3C6]